MTQGDTTWSDEEKARARAVLNGDARTVTHTSANHTVPPDQCRQWRRALRDGDTQNIRPLAEESEKFVRSTVRKHISGRCQHDPLNVGPAMEYNRNFGVWQRQERDKRPVSER